jgi:hypothetical protein
MGEARLAELLAEQISRLPYHRQREWVSRQLPPKGASKPNPSRLLDDIEAFYTESRTGTFVSWVDDDGWDGDAGDEEPEELKEWIEIFTDLMKGAQALTQAGRHADAKRAYARLLELLTEARETTDILGGNHGDPLDWLPLDFAEVVEGYARSMLASGGDRNVDDVLGRMLPTARQFRYAGGFLGLARALNAKGRDRLRAQLTAGISVEPARNRGELADTEGLIALARVGKNEKEVLALKERFASQNAVYLSEALAYRRRQGDWEAVGRLAHLGLERFGPNPEFSRALIEARRACGDEAGAQQAQIDDFLQEPTAARFVELKRRSEALGNWDAVVDKLLRAAPSTAGDLDDTPGLRSQVLLAEGREGAVLGALDARGRRISFEEAKLIAKYAVARLSQGLELSRFKRLGKLRDRLRREKQEQYEWLRLMLRAPATLSATDSALLACRMYRRLVDLHLDSGRSSRVAPAAHYCAIVFEISRLRDEAGLWTDLLRHLRLRHGRKRLIWARLRAEGCPLE